ncbi:O-acetylhomoserine aminocarboxypropyltransferase/cysteine synthase [Nocardioides sp. ChNu-153]|uniref:O-acetylhomoserine aminocarboxypropyltransferase/cysteine synthase family protein n=1 Tax=unclassified Nocardioides TaxID=2615069 RepID=UPI00240641E9|nr:MULTISPECIES: O-acetylhomoserine aminocarboxypropyltransferase/cysteine synthase family protein [unclassified Nocardioides]MDF9715974.1 O-acetylhomoserine aminocarboxypropyltransferase/cysteine synthase [Nocardioides sp. ChNu-99]MDN7119942.1 O-acetylhomoserine aminocarboxypropyltransferase/cysteine synthase [Nocardioides sp. ChNu-153]
MSYRPETLAVHAGQEEADPATNARAVPIYQTTSYVFDDTEHAANLFSLAEPGNIYTRIMNPTQSVFEDRLTQLEGGVGALATASGSAAVTYAVLNLTYAGDNIVALSTLYGGTYALFAHTLPQFGVEVRFVDPGDPQALDAAVDERTKLVFAETIGNPRLNVVDIRAWADAAHAHGLPLIVDNTTPTPYLARVFDHGADVAVHSATKYIGGHGTSVGGIIVDSGNFDWAAHAERFPGLTQPDAAYHGVVWTEAVGNLAYIIRARTVLLRNTGAAVAPLNSWLFLQGLETLHLRLERHSANALRIAEWLQGHDAVAWVSYPGLEGDPSKEVADRILTGKGYGGLVSFGLRSGRDGGRRFVEALELFSHLANIGDAKSLAIHNATTTHSQLTTEELEAAGVPEDLVRLSVGIENVDDLIADLEQALTQAK